MLLQDVERFIKAHRMPPARFGREAMRDPRFVFTLRDGRDPRPKTIARVTAYIATYSGERS